jgi:hypothetical protein
LERLRGLVPFLGDVTAGFKPVLTKLSRIDEVASLLQ